ncbi:MAG TPA: hydrogenase maturation protease [Candidatus Thermoplasmatota archaeon]|nr:hydrogenase maturation protease [Candidatus Thermoplasmatota archaeon]
MLITKKARRLLSNLETFLEHATRVVVIGMGNELRGDDAVGLEVVRLLKKHQSTRLTVYEGHMTPEVFIAPACSLKPSHLLIVDAAELNRPPGNWRLLSRDEIQTSLFTTHYLPATAVADELTRRCGTRVSFIGIQPKARDITFQRSSECMKAAQDIATLLQRLTASVSDP